MKIHNVLITSIFLLLLTAGGLKAQDQSAGTWSYDTAPGFKPHEPYFTTCVLGNKLFLLGGMNDPEYMYGQNQAEFFDPVSNTWSQIPDMPNPQGWSTSCAVGNKIYDIGSQGPWGIVQIFDTDSNKWSIGPYMHFPRYGLTSVVVDGRIYAIGGSNDSAVVSTVEILDPTSNTWSVGTPMPTPRTGLSAVVLNGEIYAIGGTSPKGNSDTVEIFNPRTNVWNIGHSLPSAAQYSITACVVDEKIYALVDGNLYIFDPTLNAWAKGPSSVLGIYNSNALNNKIYALLGTDQNFPPFQPNLLIFTPNFQADVQKTFSYSMQISPNPASTSLQVFSVRSGTARLYDMLGREMMEKELNGSNTTLDVSKLLPGTYMLRLGGQSARVVIAR